ncbi:MAG TPA: xanthine dehydrogenase family protein subunit M [Acidimicrobiales bacterium]|nr:xanthine dehydrogenase family protein subunit M [Acidimicrobiales bacterium]
MKPAPFTYHRPSTVAEVTALLAEHGDEAKVLAGGQSLVPMLALRLARFEHLVDLNFVPELAGIRANGSLVVGAMTRQAAVERSADVARTVPLLARSVPLIGHFQIRNRGTVGGSIAHADPASELPAVVLALRAEATVAGSAGRRTVPADELFVGTWTTAVEPDELLVDVRFPTAKPRSGAALVELARRHGDFAVAGAACTLSLDGDDRVADAGVALLGMGPVPLRASSAETDLAGAAPSAADLVEVAERAAAATEPVDDVHGSARYRRRVCAHLLAQALGQAFEEARRG